MPCSLITYMQAINTAYEELKECCCPCGDYPTCAEACVWEQLTCLYDNLEAMVLNGDGACCEIVSSMEPVLPDDPRTVECLDGTYMADFQARIEAMYCEPTEDEEWNLATIFGGQPARSHDCDCGNVGTRCHLTGASCTTLTIGPYCFDMELYAKTDISVDDDIAFNDVVYENGFYPAGGGFACPDCNGSHIYEAPYIFGTLECGDVLEVKMCDQQGGACGATGTLAVRILDPRTGCPP